MDICLDGIQPPKVLAQSSTVVTRRNPGTTTQHGSRNETGIRQSSVPNQDILKNPSESRDTRFGDIVVDDAGTTALPRSTWAHARHVTVFDDKDMRSDSEKPAQDAQSSWFTEQEQPDWLAFDLVGWLQPQDPATAGDAQHALFHRSFYMDNKSELGAFGSPEDTLESSLAQAETRLPYAGVYGKSFTPDAHLGREKCLIAACDHHASGFARTYDRHRQTRTCYQVRHELDRSVRDCPSDCIRASSDKTDDERDALAVFTKEVCNHLTCANAVLTEVAKMRMMMMVISTTGGDRASLDESYWSTALGLGSSEGIPAMPNLAIQG